MQLWGLLGPKNSAFHLRVSSLIWDIYSVSSPDELESFLASLLVVDDVDERIKNFQRFSTFWMTSGWFRGFKFLVITIYS